MRSNKARSVSLNDPTKSFDVRRFCKYQNSRAWCMLLYIHSAANSDRLSADDLFFHIEKLDGTHPVNSGIPQCLLNTAVLTYVSL